MDLVGPAQRLLDTIIAAETDTWQLPARRYLAAGDNPAWDTEHLLVGHAQTAPGPSDASEQPGGLPGVGVGTLVPPRASLMVRLVRCVETVDSRGHAPSAALLHADGRKVLGDVGPLLAAINQWQLAERPHKTVTWGQIDPIGPEGGLAGHLAVVTISPIQ